MANCPPSQSLRSAPDQIILNQHNNTSILPNAMPPTDTFLKLKPNDVGFKKLNDAGSKLAKAASCHNNALQHVVLSTVVAMTSMLENMDFDSDVYADTPYKIIANQMAHLFKNNRTESLMSSTESLGAPGTLKEKHHDAHGISKYRKGSEKCTTTGRKRKPKSCGFCQGDRRHFPQHTSMSNCGVKKSLGDAIRVTGDSKSEIGQKLIKIGAGEEGFPDVSTHSLFTNYAYISSAPKGTKRIQIKAYCKKDDVTYLLCAILNNRGWPMTTSHGTKTVTYENVFLPVIGAVQCVGNCDFVFFQRIKIPDDDNSCMEGKELRRECLGEEESDEDCDEGMTLKEFGSKVSDGKSDPIIMECSDEDNRKRARKSDTK